MGKISTKGALMSDDLSPKTVTENPVAKSKPPKSPNFWQKMPTWAKILAPLALVLGLVGIGMAAYWIGVKSTVVEPSPSPSLTIRPTPTLNEDEADTGFNLPTPTPSPTPKPSPTATPTPTPTPTPEPVEVSKSLSATAALDGFRSSNNAGNDSADIRTGRNVTLITRGFVSFDLTDVPSGAKITQAKLALYLAKVIGDPMSAGVRVKVDHLDYGTSLESADYGASSLSASFGTLTEDGSVGWKEVNVADQVQADLDAGRSRSQFRIHLAVENPGGDVTGDFLYFESADNSEGTGNRPQLNLKYTE